MALVFLLALTPGALAQVRPYIGFAFPAGGQQGTNVQIRLGGQGVDDVIAVLVSGTGVSAKVVECLRRLNNQEVQLLNEQIKELKRATSSVAKTAGPQMMMMQDNSMMMMSSGGATGQVAAGAATNSPTLQHIARLEKRTREFVQTPACAAISSLVIVDVAIKPDAQPGEHEIRVMTPRGISNPLPFHVGQVPEYTRKPMLSATIQTLGKEAAALRKRPAEEAEVRINIPATVNGQIASGEVNRYRFEARKGQRLVITTLGRQLIPFIADAVPGWFQPVLALYDEKGHEVAYDDDYRFKPDPTLFYEVPADGEYFFTIRDSIYRGREDFVYRITVGELPFITSIFPLGEKAGGTATPKMTGWNLEEAELKPLGKDPGGLLWLAANRKGVVSNRVPFESDTLPEILEQEPNNDPARAQKVTLPVMINGRIDKPDDWDVFEFTAKANDTVVAEVHARRLDSPLDSIIKLTDAKGKVLAFNDDHEDLGAGANTHHADSLLMTKLPADGSYFVHIGDTARAGGEAYAYRLRLSAPRPDFAARVVPSSLSIRGKSTAVVNCYAQRKDGYVGPIKFTLKNPPAGITSAPVVLLGTAAVARLTITSQVASLPKPVNLTVVGIAKIGESEVVHPAVPAEDRMQAFLWRHLVPASELKFSVIDPGYELPPKRLVPARVASLVKAYAVAATNPAVALKLAATNAPAGTNTVAASKPKFTKQQVAGRLRELKRLYEEGYITESFYYDKVVECEAAQ